MTTDKISAEIISLTVAYLSGEVMGTTQQIVSHRLVAQVLVFHEKNPNSLNFNVNSPNLVHICGYEVPITGQFFSKKNLTLVKILLRAFLKKIKKLEMRGKA